MDRFRMVLVGLAVFAMTGCAATQEAEAPAQQSGAQQAIDVSGKWRVTTGKAMAERYFSLTLNQDGQTLTGTMADEDGGLMPVKGTVSDNQIAFTVQEPVRGEILAVEYLGQVQGSAMNGKADFTGHLGEEPFKARKQ